MENKNNEEKKKFKLIDLVKNKQYYAIANLVFYSCLILVLIIGIRTSPSTSDNSSNLNNNGSNAQTKIEGYSNIKNKNYNFKYILSVDNVKTEYIGKQRENKILFTDKTNNKEYFVQDNIVLVKENNKFVLSDFKTQYFNYLDVDVIEEILSLSTKDEDEYIITGENFEKIISSKGISDDYEIYIQIHKTNNIITKIDFDLTEYVTLNVKNIIGSVKLELEYSNFNLIEEFDITK